MSDHPIYHAGELAVQRQAGVDAIAHRVGGMVRQHIPTAALAFIGQQPMVVISSMAADGQVWASMLFGRPGFMRAAEPSLLDIELSDCGSPADSVLCSNLNNTPDIGLLLIDLASRRRLRINGRARWLSARQLRVDIERAYPNCPKYIQRRRWLPPTADKVTGTDIGTGPKAKLAQPTLGTRLTPSQQRWIGRSDTFFVASAHPRHGLDASHRGGHPGFVSVLSDQLLQVPDFVGNSMFNTLGNFTSYPQAGLVFPDFERGRLLQITGRPEILWDQADPHQETGGTRRYWRLEIAAWRETTLPLPLAWTLPESSPFIPPSTTTPTPPTGRDGNHDPTRRTP